MKTLNENDLAFVCDIQAPCFQKLLSDEIELIKSSKTQVMFHKGENLTKQGAFASYILFIIDGLVKQYIETDATKKFNLRLLQSGDFIGLPVIFNKKIFDFSTVAVRETKAFLVSIEAMENLVKQNGQFAYSIIKRNYEQESDLYNILRNLLHKQMNGRLADALLYISSDIFAGEDIFSSLSRRDIADFAGISTESAVKLLKTFEKEGIIKLEEKNILIENKEMLKQISKNG